MLAQTDIERERYEARRKAQLDYNTAMKVAQLDGLIRMIHFCERLLHRPETPTDQLDSLPLDQLKRLSSDLQAEVEKQR